MQIYLYCLSQCLELMYVDDQLRPYETNNLPMNNKDYVKLHKGINNKVRIKVVDADYKRVDISHLEMKAVIVNPVTREVVLLKTLTCVEKGYLYLEVLESELIDISRGLYQMTIRGENPNAYSNVSGISAYEGFYKDLDSNLVFPVEITGEGDTRPAPSIETSQRKWLPSYESVVGQPVYVSPPLPANNTRNTMNSLHTFTVHSEGPLNGILKLYGTLEANPTSDDQLWFEIDYPLPDRQIEYDEFSGIDVHSFTGNFTYIRMKWTPDVGNTGEIDKVEYRN